MIAKKIAAEKAVEYIRDGMTVGLGSGSTAFYAIQKIGERVKEGLKIKAVATSVKSENIARGLNIPVYQASEVESIDIAIDGADEVDQYNNLIKGGGGSLLREKIIAFASKKFHVMVDESKLSEKLGTFPLPVEIVPFAAELTLKHLKALGGDVSLRKVKEEIFVTDNGNLIADCRFGTITDPAKLDAQIKTIPGIVETGLFINRMVSSVIVGHKNGEVTERVTGMG